MAVDLKGRSFLTLKDFTSEEIEYFIDVITSRLCYLSKSETNL